MGAGSVSGMGRRSIEHSGMGRREEESTLGYTVS